MTATRIHPAILAGDGPCTHCQHGQWHHRAGSTTCRACTCTGYRRPTTPTPTPTPPTQARPAAPTLTTQLADAHARIAELETALRHALTIPPAGPATWGRIARERDQAIARADHLAAQVDHLREEVRLLRESRARHLTAARHTTGATA